MSPKIIDDWGKGGGGVALRSILIHYSMGEFMKGSQFVQNTVSNKCNKYCILYSIKGAVDFNFNSFNRSKIGMHGDISILKF